VEFRATPLPGAGTAGTGGGPELAERGVFGRGGGFGMACFAQVITPDGKDWQRLSAAAGSREALQAIKQRHESGAACVLRISGAACGLVVLWSEINAQNGREIVLALGTGTGAKYWIPWAVQFSKDNRAGSIRTHCQRPGLIRLYEKNGFQVVGTDPGGYTILRFENGR